jgi:hypothetical protein
MPSASWSAAFSAIRRSSVMPTFAPPSLTSTTRLMRSGLRFFSARS